MRTAKALFSAGVLCVLASVALTGCETGRVNKLHSRYEHTMDVTTSPHPDAQYASVSAGDVPVPGSPTAAGPDGTQPFNDSQARKDPGAEKGQPTPPREQTKDPFLHQ